MLASANFEADGTMYNFTFKTLTGYQGTVFHMFANDTITKTDLDVGQQPPMINVFPSSCAPVPADALFCRGTMITYEQLEGGMTS